MSEERKQLKLSDIIALIEAGKTRNTIRKELGLTIAQVAELFKHPKLKNKRARGSRGVAFDLVDDLEGDTPASAPVAATTSRRSTAAIPAENTAGALTGQEATPAPAPTEQAAPAPVTNNVIDAPVQDAPAASADDWDFVDDTAASAEEPEILDAEDDERPAFDR